MEKGFYVGFPFGIGVDFRFGFGVFFLLGFGLCFGFGYRMAFRFVLGGASKLECLVFGVDLKIGVRLGFGF